MLFARTCGNGSVEAAEMVSAPTLISAGGGLSHNPTSPFAPFPSFLIDVRRCRDGWLLGITHATTLQYFLTFPATTVHGGLFACHVVSYTLRGNH